MATILSLKPHDVCVALQIVLTPEADFRSLAASLGLSLGETHNATQRLQAAQLVLSHRRVANQANLVDFVISGVPYAFPGELGPETLGVPTAHSGPYFRERIDAADVVVWPDHEGSERGAALIPLYARAVELPKRNPALYRWLTAIDVLRVGRARERNIARQLFEREILADDSDAEEGTNS